MSMNNKINKKKEIELGCSCLSSKNAYGKIHMYNQINLNTLAENQFIIKDIKKEELKLENALHESKEQLEKLEKQVTETIDKEFGNIFLAHKLLLEDCTIMDELRRRIKEEKVNTEYLLAKQIKGIIVEESSNTAHITIMAKSMNIPVAINIPEITSIIRSTDMLLIIGARNKIVINPGVEKIAKAEKYFLLHENKTKKRYKPITKDGKKVNIQANIAELNDVQQANLFGAAGIGLLRTEFFYMIKDTKPEIQKETNFYNEIANNLGNKPLTIRLLDTGGDKKFSYFKYKEEINPQMGLKGIRYLLKNKDIFESHLISILNIKQIQNIKLLLPFITTKEDIVQAKIFINETIKEQGMDKLNLPLGIMIETPSAALLIEDLMEYIDFISIGTNDLSQFIFASSREDSGINEYLHMAHPLLFRLINNICITAQKYNKEVSVCGELASNPKHACLLLGLGVNSLSVSPECIPDICNLLSKFTSTDLIELADSIIKLTDEKKMEKALFEYFI